MTPSLIATIAGKELREAFRDRRTLFLMVFLPMLLYPGLLLLLTQVASVQVAQLEEQVSQVGIVGVQPTHDLWETLASDDMIELREIDPAGLPPFDATTPDSAPLDPLTVQLDAIVDARGWDVAEPYPTIPIVTHFVSVSEESRQAVDRIETALTAWVDAEMTRRLQRLELPASFADPLEPQLVNHATQQAQGGYVLGAVLPLFVIVTVLLGAYYPAIDLTAGEKERGSIQTLFTAPIATVDIVAGKYLAVVAIAMVSGLANLGSIVLVVGQGIQLAGDLASEFDLSLTGGVVMALLWNICLIALFFSALLLAVAVLARSFKEAQTYISPVYLVCIVPAMIAQLPGVEFTPQLGVVPAVGTILLMKELLLHGVSMDALFLTSAATLAWTAIALAAAARLFGREDVVFGERASLRIIPRRAEMKPALRPGPGAGIAWYAVSFVLLFYVGATLQAKWPRPGLAATLWLVLLAPTVLLAWWTKLDLRETFALRAPSWRGWAAALLLGVSSLIVVQAANGLVEQFLLETPPELAEEMAKFFPDPETGLDWLLLIALVGISPAVCEEALFRGYLFSSLRGHLKPVTIVLATAVMFGVFHLSIYRLFGTTMLGVVMGLLVWRTRSIYTSALFHMLNNSLAVVAAFTLADSTANDLELPTWLVVAGFAGFAAGMALLFSIPAPPDDD